MEKVSLLQFRHDAKAIIRQVAQGKRLILTYRGKPVMRLEPITDRPIGQRADSADPSLAGRGGPSPRPAGGLRPRDRPLRRPASDRTPRVCGAGTAGDSGDCGKRSGGTGIGDSALHGLVGCIG